MIVERVSESKKRHPVLAAGALLKACLTLALYALVGLSAIKLVAFLMSGACPCYMTEP